MKLTLELDGKTCAINLEGLVTDKLKTMQEVCVLLDDWHTEVMKDELEANGSTSQP